MQENARKCKKMQDDPSEDAKNPSKIKQKEELYISQPNLSISIQNLEKELGYPLFLRNNRGVELTPLGQIFIGSAETIVEKFDQLATSCLNPKDPKTSTFSVAAMPYRYLTEVGIHLYEAHKDDPIHLSMQSGTREEIIDFVGNGVCELGICSIYQYYYNRTVHKILSDGLTFTPLGRQDISILVGKSSPLYQLESPTINRSQLEGHCFVGFSELEHGTYSALPDLLGLGQDRCPQRIYASTWSLILDIISATDSFTIAATNRKAYERTSYYHQLKSFTLEDCDETCVTGWISKEGRGLSPLAEEYLKILSGYF